MTKFRLIFSVLFLAGSSVFGQALEISGFGGYTLSGKSNYINGEVDIRDGAHWGGSLGVELPTSEMVVQFIYMRNETSGRAIEYKVLGTDIYEVNRLVIEHFHLGVDKPIGGNEMIKPYTQFSLGVTNYAARNIVGPGLGGIKEDDVARFSMGLGAGVKIFPTEKIGLKLQARMTMPLLFSGVGIFCGTDGCGGGSSFYVPLVHGEFSGGLVFRLVK